MQYAKIRNILMLVFMMIAFTFAQEDVVQLVPYDGSEGSFLGIQIIADTTANHGILPNRVYELQRGGIYLAKTQLRLADPGETLHLRAAAGEGAKPIIYLYPTGTGDNPERPPGYLFRTQGGDLIMENIGLTGYFEPHPEKFDNIQGGMLRNDVGGGSFFFDGCIFSNTRGQVLRTEKSTITTSVRNCIFANLGSLVGSNLGAGKGIDLRDQECVLFVLENNTFVNYQDRVVRHYNFGDPGAGTGLIHSGFINHNTIVNGMGFHGLLSLGSVGAEMTITNNLFVDAFGLGEDSTDATRAAEWANTGETYANGNNRITWIFTSPNDVTNWTVSNNYWAVSDSGQAFLDDFDFGYADQLSQHITDRLGAAAAADAFTKIDIALEDIPPMMTNMMRWYEDPEGGNKTKNTPCECFDPETDDMHRRSILWLRDTLDASYPTSSTAYTGSTTGGPVGDLNWFGMATAIDNDDSKNRPISFILEQNYPNPFNPTTKINFQITKAGKVNLAVYNVLGQKVATLVKKNLKVGKYTIDWDATGFASGIYFYRIQAGDFSQTKKMILVR